MNASTGSAGFMGRVYSFVGRHRRLYLFLTAIGILSFAVLFLRVDLDATIDAMLPDDDSATAADFARLQQSPFARKIVIQVSGDKDVSVAELVAAVDRIAAALSPKYFQNIVRGPVDFGTPETLTWLTAHVPHLVTNADLDELTAATAPDEVRGRLRRAYRQLVAPEGLMAKELIRQDPLNFRRVALRKLEYLRVVPEVEVARMHFVSPDRRSALILAETKVPMTDFVGGRELMDAFAAANQEALPAEFEAMMICGHRYAVGNAERSQRDAVLVLVVASVGIVLLFLVFLRSWHAIFVFLVPAAVLSVAAVVTAAVYGQLAAVTLGFGAVLLGISVDFALHVFFALRGRSAAAKPAALAKVTRPVLFGGVTTIAAFAVLLVSALPGQRQLAVFSITGLISALFLALVILPHVMGQATLKHSDTAADVHRPQYRKPVVIAWLVVMIVLAWPARTLVFSGDLRRLNYVPRKLAQDEQRLRETWGDMRGRAMVFVEGVDVQDALQRNDQLFSILRDDIPAGDLVSLSPLLPAVQTQEQKLQRWRKVWTDKRVEDLRAALLTHGAAFGFSENAFSPFLNQLASPLPPFTPEALGAAGLDELTRTMLIENEEQTTVISMVPDSVEMVSLFKQRVRDKQVHLVSQTAFGQALGRVIARDVKRFLAAAAVMVVLLLGLLFRSPKKVLVALVPVVSGLMAMAGLMALFALPVTPVNLIAGILVIGLGVDYGIFMVERCVSRQNLGTETAVLVSGLTTLVGFGSLLLAKHPVMRSIGISMSFGITAAMITALFVIPAIYTPPVKEMVS